jgi:hypothetical protein
MGKLKSWEVITEIGRKMQMKWQDLANSHGISITVSGIPALSTYGFNSKKAMEYKTFVAQEMLKKGFLASTNFYACTEHTDDKFELYFNALNDVYAVIAKCEKGELNIESLLEGPVCHSGFKRLN